MIVTVVAQQRVAADGARSLFCKIAPSVAPPLNAGRWTAAINLAFRFLIQLRSFRQSLSWGV